MNGWQIAGTVVCSLACGGVVTFFGFWFWLAKQISNGL